MRYGILATIFAGGAAGLLGSLLAPHLSPSNARNAIRDVAVDERAPAEKAPAALDQLRIAQLESELRSLHQKVNVVASGRPATRDAEPPPPSPEEAGRERHEKREDAIASHWQEPVDRAWSAEFTSTFDRELSGFAEAGHFSVEKIDCRSSTCVADIEFKNYAEARTGWSKITPTDHGGHPFTVDIEVQPPDDPNVPYTATILYTAIKR